MSFDVDVAMHKCPYCGLYFPGYDIGGHMSGCNSNPNNQEK